MSIAAPFNLNAWIEEHRDQLRPPVGNIQVYKDNKDFIVMIVGGPNARKDYHYNEGEELFYQIKGDIVVKIIDDGEPKDIHIKEGEMWLLPPKTPHSPQRGPNTIGLVVERYRYTSEDDGFLWFCEKCNSKLYEEYLPLKDIVQQLPVVMGNYYENKAHCTCRNCGHVMEKPVLKS
jgi:3-hydroxyanthranilate 3,4-dioxygenase